MSRSVGDSLASQLGVIAEPLVHTFSLYAGADQFVIMGSDGLWDTVSNLDAVRFVDRFRGKSRA